MNGSDLEDSHLPLLATWAQLWSCDGLEQRLTISFSPRLRSSLGRCTPARRDLRIAAFLLEAPRPLLHEVLCHEAAHAAVYELHGRAARAHGREWKRLMQLAGFEPRARIPESELAGLPEPARRARKLWEHRCPVCQMRRLAGRPVPQWRCAQCYEAGLSGELVIERTDAAAVDFANRPGAR